MSRVEISLWLGQGTQGSGNWIFVAQTSAALASRENLGAKGVNGPVTMSTQATRTHMFVCNKYDMHLHIQNISFTCVSVCVCNYYMIIFIICISFQHPLKLWYKLQAPKHGCSAISSPPSVIPWSLPSHSVSGPRPKCENFHIPSVFCSCLFYIHPRIVFTYSLR